METYCLLCLEWMPIRYMSRDRRWCFKRCNRCIAARQRPRRNGKAYATHVIGGAELWTKGTRYTDTITLEVPDRRSDGWPMPSAIANSQPQLITAKEYAERVRIEFEHDEMVVSATIVAKHSEKRLTQRILDHIDYEETGDEHDT
jgi:hypothetical protein